MSGSPQTLHWVVLLSKGYTKMSWRRAKTRGWAAFDLQQKQKDIVEARPSNEPFPSLPSGVTSFQPSTTFLRNNHPYVKPFSSVITLGNQKSGLAEVDSSAGPQSSEVSRDNKVGQVFRQLKELYSWADGGLIEDIMAAVDNDLEKASCFLKAMVSDESSEKKRHNMVVKSARDSIELVSNEKTLPVQREVHPGKISEPFKACTVLDSHAGDDNGGRKDQFDLREEKIFDSCINNSLSLDQLTCIPIEPEWEEDDLYLSCRKDAIKMRRAAARHSKSATNSFLRGDHFAAQQFSMKAREEWTAAKKLNEKAAHEILSTRNENNGLWKLDLHGLHAVEAVQALQERLQTIETQGLTKGPNSLALPKSFGTKAVPLHAVSSGGCNDVEKSVEHTFSGQKPKCLEVITGIGNYSRGGAALPTAVKTFLADNGYRFDEARAGVIMVRPKFRHV